MGLCTSWACPLSSLSFWVECSNMVLGPSLFVCLLVYVPIPFAYLVKVRCEGGCWGSPTLVRCGLSYGFMH
jgi:hypothetical protein